VFVLAINFALLTKYTAEFVVDILGILAYTAPEEET